MCNTNQENQISQKSLKINNLPVLENNRLASDIVELVLECPKAVKNLIKPCQFFNLGLKDHTQPLLKRPISVSRVSEKGVHFVIKELGEGTRRLTNLKIGESIQAVGPLGNGIALESIKAYEDIILIGGGIGTAPLLELAQVAYKEEKNISTFLGYLKEPYLIQEFSKVSSEVNLCTIEKIESPSELEDIKNAKFIEGHVGIGLELYLKELEQEIPLKRKLAVACGPDKMLKAIKTQLEKSTISMDLLVVTEERMACGMGACLVCAKKVIQNEEVKMLRTCIEGPVFKAEEVEFE